MYDKILGKLVDKSEYNRRFNLCKDCNYFINLTKQCKKCFCFLPIKAKVEKALCPIGNW